MNTNLKVWKFFNENKCSILFLCLFILCIRILDYIFRDKNNVKILDDSICVNLYNLLIDQVDLTPIPADRDLHILIDSDFSIQIIEKIYEIWPEELRRFIAAGRQIRFYDKYKYLSFLGYTYGTSILFSIEGGVYFMASQTVLMSMVVANCNRDLGIRSAYSDI